MFGTALDPLADKILMSVVTVSLTVASLLPGEFYSLNLLIYHHSQPSTLNLQPSTLNPQPSTLNPQPSTLNPQPSTLNLQPSTRNPHPSPLNPHPSPPPHPTSPHLPFPAL